jgi:hypothetical protein
VLTYSSLWYFPNDASQRHERTPDPLGSAFRVIDRQCLHDGRKITSSGREGKLRLFSSPSPFKRLLYSVLDVADLVFSYRVTIAGGFGILLELLSQDGNAHPAFGRKIADVLL